MKYKGQLWSVLTDRMLGFCPFNNCCKKKKRGGGDKESAANVPTRITSGCISSAFFLVNSWSFDIPCLCFTSRNSFWILWVFFHYSSRLFVLHVHAHCFFRPNQAELIKAKLVLRGWSWSYTYHLDLTSVSGTVPQKTGYMFLSGYILIRHIILQPHLRHHVQHLIGF